MKRWIAVAVAWAVAATAVALIALLDGSSSTAERDADDAAGRVSDLRRTTDRRMDTLEGRLENLPQAADVSRLNDRLARLEDQSTKAATDAKNANDKLKALEDRVGEAERRSVGGDADSPPTPDSP